MKLTQCQKVNGKYVCTFEDVMEPDQMVQLKASKASMLTELSDAKYFEVAVASEKTSLQNEIDLIDAAYNEPPSVF